jgi:hypothetical protein
MKTFTIVAVILVAAVLLFLMMPAPDATKWDQGYPWNIQTTNRSVSVFGVELGYTPLQTFIVDVGDSGETAILQDRNGDLSLETYFSNLNLSGFETKMILRSTADPSVLQKWANQAGRGKLQAGGARKLLLNDAQLQQARQLPIAAITYVPRVAYDADIAAQRFGEPESREKGPDDSEYWFYPTKGLILILSKDTREVLHYVSPADFAVARKNLLHFPQD